MDINDPRDWPVKYKELYKTFIRIQSGWWEANLDTEYPWLQTQFDDARDELFRWVANEIGEGSAMVANRS